MNHKNDVPNQSSFLSRRGLGSIAVWFLLVAVVVWAALCGLALANSLFTKHRPILAIATLLLEGVLAVFLCRWLSRRRYVSPFLFSLAWLITFAVLFYAEENWRGKRAWEKYRSDLIARGEMLEWKANVPPSVPDEENFARTPLLKAIGTKSKVDTNVWARFDYVGFGELAPFLGSGGSWDEGRLATDLEACQKTLRASTHFNLPPLPRAPAEDVLDALRKLQPEFDELRAASLRRYSQFVINPELSPEQVEIPNYVAYRTLIQLLSLRATAELALAQNKEALKDMIVMQRLTESLKSELTLVSAMIRVAISGVTVHTFWEGWSAGKWSDAQLEQLQKLFLETDLLATLDRGWRNGERNGVNTIVERYTPRRIAEVFRMNDSKENATWFDATMAFVPRGWIYQNQLVYTRLVQEAASFYDVRGQQVFPAKTEGFTSTINEVTKQRTPFNLLASVAMPNITKAIRTCARTQTSVNQAAVACALERYRRTNGYYPQTLGELSPRFIATLPHDIVGGQPLRYHVGPGGYALYSVGWNQKDEAGVWDTRSGKDDWMWTNAAQKQVAAN
jgi:hypothetical protein